MSIITVRDLVKEYHRPKRQTGRFGALRTLLTREVEVTRAIDGISFTVAEGELLGYIGANGAGKSTTIKMLTGILTPTSGAATVAGLVPWEQRERNALNIGVVFGQRSQLWWDLPLIESFALVAKMYRIPPPRYRANLERFVELLEMDAFMQTPVRQLSLGQRMRGDLVAAMLHEPRILYLDEPTVGLDVLAKERIRLFIEEMNRERQTTIILTTHDLHDVERLCRRIVLVNHGRLVYDGAIDTLKAGYARYRVLGVQHTGGEGMAIEARGAELVRREGSSVWLRFDPTRTPVAALIADVVARYPVTDLSIEEPALEQVVREMYEAGQEAS